jgi:hypothetical protein
MQQSDISSVDGSFVRFEGSVVAAEGILQWCGPPVGVPRAATTSPELTVSLYYLNASEH